MLWEAGAAINLGNLGGDGLFGGHHACAINNRGQVVGHSDLTGDTTFHTFLWTWETGMKDLGTLPGDFASYGDLDQRCRRRRGSIVRLEFQSDGRLFGRTAR